MKRILPKKISFGRRKKRKSREYSFLRWRKKARNPRTSQDTRRGQHVLVFHSARGSISLSRSLSFPSSNPHHSKLCTTKLLSSLSSSSPLNLPFAKKRRKTKIHPPTTPTRNSTSHHTVSLVCSGFNQPSSAQENKDHSYLLLSLLDYYRSWEADDRSIITAKSRLGRTGFLRMGRSLAGNYYCCLLFNFRFWLLRFCEVFGVAHRSGNSSFVNEEHSFGWQLLRLASC
jgi:hypothetical protein